MKNRISFFEVDESVKFWREVGNHNNQKRKVSGFDGKVIGCRQLSGEHTITTKLFDSISSFTFQF